MLPEFDSQIPYKNQLNMKKEHQVVLLSTRDKTNLYLSPSNILASVAIGSGGAGSNQHLYICSNDEIKVEDWFYFTNETTKYIQQAPQHWRGSKEFDGFHYKIIATTDSSLNDCTSCGNVGCHLCIGKDLPLIPQSFINSYIKAYNEGNIITSVIVEYIVDTDGNWNYNPENDGKLFYIPKLNSNEIIISEREEKLYTREEVLYIIENLHMYKGPADWQLREVTKKLKS